MVGNLNQKHVLLVTPVAQTNSATSTANLDTKGADYATIVVSLSARVNTSAVAPTISLLSSDDTVVTNFATVTADRSESCASAHNLIYHVDTRARKRYLRLSVTTGTTTNDDVTVGAIGVLGRLEIGPKSTSYMIGSTNDAVVMVS